MILMSKDEPRTSVNGSYYAYRQKTNLTTLGIFFEGFFVSPAVIPKLSVPPTKEARISGKLDLRLPLTCKAGRYKHPRKTTEATNEGGTWNSPIAASDVPAFTVDPDIDQDPHDDKDDDCDDFQGGKPVL